MARNENWIKEVTKTYGSLENYVRNIVDGGAEPLLFGYKSFQYLWDKKLLQENDVVRTNLEGGYRDGHYLITSEGNLKGIEAAGGLYSGDEGIYIPKDRLNLKKADNGWTIDYFAKSRICYSTRNTKI